MNSTPGVFVSFEGIDFCGKSEQARRLFNRLSRAKGNRVELLREPGGVEIAEKIREILLDEQNARMDSRTELLLYSAARAQITAEKILPALQEGKTIIADRYFDSTSVYQGIGRELDRTFVESVNRFATRGKRPDLTILIDLPVEVAQRRRRFNRLQQDRLERENSAFHERIRQGYLEVAKNESARFVVVDGARQPQEIENEIAEIIRKRFDLGV